MHINLSRNLELVSRKAFRSVLKDLKTPLQFFSFVSQYKDVSLRYLPISYQNFLKLFISYRFLHQIRCFDVQTNHCLCPSQLALMSSSVIASNKIITKKLSQAKINRPSKNLYISFKTHFILQPFTIKNS